ncbi:MAG: cytochrome P450 [Myxococcota bacterium]
MSEPANPIAPGPAAADPWLGANPLDPAFREDPHPGLKQLRERQPVHRAPFGFWRLTRYRDVVRLLRDVPAGVRRTDGTLPGAEISDGRAGQFMLQRDPPDHTRLRKLVSKAFTPRATENWRARAEAIVEDLLDRVADAGEMDVIADLALPVPATVICELLGVPVADRDRFTNWTADATHGLAAQFSPPEVLARAMAAGDALGAYFEDLIAERRRNLGDDLLSQMIRAEEEGDRLSADDLLFQSIGLLIAGFETTIGLIGNGVKALIDHPDQLACLQAEPERIGAAVEECLRFDGPILLTVRILHEDVDFGGITIPKDSQVAGILAAANRDPAVFEDPERFDIGRDPNPHLAFGGGTHYCLGTHLARMEAQSAIGRLLQRFTAFERVDEKVEWGASLFRVPASLPVRFRVR